MKRLFLSTLCVTLVAIQLFAQHYPSKGIDFTAPKAYSFTPMIRAEMDDLKAKTGVPFMHIQAFDTLFMYESNDKNCMVFYGHPYSAGSWRGGVSQYAIDEQQNRLIYSAYDATRKITSKHNIDNYVTHVSHAEAKKRFNADSLIILEAPIKKEYRGKNIDHSLTLMLMQKPNPPKDALAIMQSPNPPKDAINPSKNTVFLICMMLLTEEGYKNKEKYLADINNTITFTGEIIQTHEWVYKRNSNRPPMSPDSAAIFNEKRIERVTKALNEAEAARKAKKTN